MRTTLTLDEDVLALVHETAHEEHRTMKSVVNEALREALSSHRPVTAYAVTPHDSQLRPGIDRGRLNQPWTATSRGSPGSRGPTR